MCAHNAIALLAECHAECCALSLFVAVAQVEPIHVDGKREQVGRAHLRSLELLPPDNDEGPPGCRLGIGYLVEAAGVLKEPPDARVGKDAANDLGPLFVTPERAARE